MKRLLLKISLLILSIACLCAGISCAQTQNLSEPQNVVMDEMEILSWEKVERAKGYCVVINDKEYKTEETGMDLFALLNEPGDYEISVYAYRGNKKSNAVSLTYQIQDASDLFTYEQVKERYILTKFQTKEWTGKLIIPSTNDGKTIDFIRSPAFLNVKGITGVYIDGIEEVDQDAFKGCSSIKRVYVADGVKAFSGFSSCTALERVDLPMGLENLNNGAFQDCISLKEVNIPESVTFISAGIFWGCTSLEKVHIPKNVETIYSSFLAGCTNLQSLTVDAENPFYKIDGNCILEKETNVLAVGTDNAQIPEYVKEIGHGAFTFCTFKTISLPEGLEIIGKKAFNHCENLEYITIPSTVKIIKEGAFYHCVHLMTVRLPEGLQTIEKEAFYDCFNASTTLPDSVTTIGDEGFYYMDIYTPCITPKEGWVDDSSKPYNIQTWAGASKRINGCQYGYDGAYPYVTQVEVVNPWGTGIFTGSTNVGMTVPYREGYTFKGWSKEKDGEVVFNPYVVPTQRKTGATYDSAIKSYICYEHQECFKDNQEEFYALTDGMVLYAVWEKTE